VARLRKPVEPEVVEVGPDEEWLAEWTRRLELAPLWMGGTRPLDRETAAEQARHLWRQRREDRVVAAGLEPPAATASARTGRR
jgi:hypothetical protein